MTTLLAETFNSINLQERLKGMSRNRLKITLETIKVCARLSTNPISEQLMAHEALTEVIRTHALGNVNI